MGDGKNLALSLPGLPDVEVLAPPRAPTDRHRRDDLPAPPRTRLVSGRHLPEAPPRRAPLSAIGTSRPMPGAHARVAGAAEAGAPRLAEPPGVQVHPRVVDQARTGGRRGRGYGG